MTKRVLIIHGWGGKPDTGWFKWINSELSSRDFEVHIERMPDPDNPKIDTWVNHLKKEIPNPDKETYFIGHSIGCQTILRYIKSIPEKTKVGGVIFVAGWFNAKGLETEEEQKIAEPWIKSKIDLKNAKQKISKIIAIFSDNDPFVPLEDSSIFKNKLGAEIIIEKNQGHFIESEIMEIPILLKKMLEIAK